ncbi:MAG: VCBS repeat-containing protein [Planctomycetales bacterium]|nr:VCBS repeat-containing protein [Planctomycetales bacterium]
MTIVGQAESVQQAPVVPQPIAAEVAHVQLPNQVSSVQDPKDDGWDSEAFAAAAATQLKKLAKAIADRQLDIDQHVANETGAYDELRPQSLVQAFDERGVQAFRSPEDSAISKGAPSQVNLSRQLERLIQPHGNADIEAHFKIVGVDLAGDSVKTRVFFDAKSAAGKAVQQKATWTCLWHGDQSNPVLAEIHVADYEEVVSQVPAENGVWFTDVTDKTFGDTPAFHNQLAHGLNHWLQRFERAQLMDDSVRTGLAIGDINGDGRDDVYCCQGPGLPNRLLIQKRDGSVEDISRQSATDWLDQTSAALILDFDNDGDQDLAIATRGGLLLMKNVGSARFELMAQLGPDGIDSQSIVSADYDQDGDLDIFVCSYRPPSGRRSGDFVFHDAVTGGANFLFRNDITDGKWTWTDVTAEVGLAVGSDRYSLAAGWEDYDDDGDQDLYLANDYGRNYLYRNDSGKFVDVTEEAGLRDTGFGMSVGWGDFNNDGVSDLYVGNMFSSAGSRITTDPKFQPNSSDRQKAIYRRMAKGNSLFLGKKNTFAEVTDTAGVAMGRWAWSSVFSDLNSDGFQDIVIANGYITTEDTGDL